MLVRLACWPWSTREWGGGAACPAVFGRTFPRPLPWEGPSVAHSLGERSSLGPPCPWRRGVGGPSLGSMWPPLSWHPGCAARPQTRKQKGQQMLQTPHLVCTPAPRDRRAASVWHSPCSGHSPGQGVRIWLLILRAWQAQQPPRYQLSFQAQRVLGSWAPSRGCLAMPSMCLSLNSSWRLSYWLLKGEGCGWRLQAPCAGALGKKAPGPSGQHLSGALEDRRGSRPVGAEVTRPNHSPPLADGWRAPLSRCPLKPTHHAQLASRHGKRRHFRPRWAQSARGTQPKAQSHWPWRWRELALLSAAGPRGVQALPNL